MVLSLLVNVGLGFLYFGKYKDFNNLNEKYNNVVAENQKISTSSAELKKQIKTLENQNKATEAAFKAKSDKVKSYTALFSYLNTVIKAHNGLDGWTDAEYQKGRGLAQATGDQSIVTKTDWAWNRKDIDQITRLVGWLDEVVNGINNALK